MSDVETALTAAYNAGADPSIPTYAVSVGGDVAQLTAFATSAAAQVETLHGRIAKLHPKEMARLGFVGE